MTHTKIIEKHQSSLIGRCMQDPGSVKRFNNFVNMGQIMNDDDIILRMPRWQEVSYLISHGYDLLN